jgi:hypothetical protein
VHIIVPALSRNIFDFLVHPIIPAAVSFAENGHSCLNEALPGAARRTFYPT